MVDPGSLNTQAYANLRRELKAEWQAVDAVCWLCGQPIDWHAPAFTAQAFELDHVKSRKHHPELTLDRTNCRPSHHGCNRSKGKGEGQVPLGTTSEAW